MGYTVTLSGTLTIETQSETTAVAAMVASGKLSAKTGRSGQPLTNLGDVIAEVLGFEPDDLAVPRADGAVEVLDYSFWYNGKWGYSDADLAVIAEFGATGELCVTGEEDAQWKILLAAGKCREISAVTFYPDDPDPDADTVLLTRRNARALLALLAGDHVDGLPAVVAKLTAAVNRS